MIQFVKPVDSNIVWWHKAILERWIDADSAVMSVLDRGFNEFKHGARVRLAFIDAPERFTGDGKLATAFVRDMVPDGAEVLLYSHRDTSGRYGRILAEIVYNGVNVNKAILDAGHAIIPSYVK